MEWSVIFTSVVVSAIVGAVTNVFIAKINNRNVRKNIRYEKLYAIYTEIKALPTPPPALNGPTLEQVELEVDYFNAVRKKYELAKPLLAVELQQEIDNLNGEIVSLTEDIMEDWAVAKKDGKITMDGTKYHKVSKLRIEYETEVENVIRKQLSELG